MPLLKRDEILKASDLTFEDVDVPEWGGVVRVRALSGAERDRFEQSCVVQQGKKTKMNMNNIRAKLCALTLVDEAGLRIFSDLDVEALGAKSAAALDRVFDVAQRLSGISDDDLEELEKNSESVQGDAFYSG
jgi:hypothetical protein